MFSKLSLLITATIAASVLAVPTPWDGGDNVTVNQCNTGSLQCCNSVQDAKSPSLTGLLGLVGIAVGDITGQVGVTCNPITVIGIASGSSCSAQPACCTRNNFGGVVALGCNPINLNL